MTPNLFKSIGVAKNVSFSQKQQKQNPRRHGGKILRATKGPVTKELLGQKILIPKGCSLRVFKSPSGVVYRAVLLNEHGQPFKTFFQGRLKSSGPSIIYGEGQPYQQ